MRGLILSIFFAALLVKMYNYARVDVSSPQGNSTHKSSKTLDISSLEVKGFELSQSYDNRLIYKVESPFAEKISDDTFKLTQINAVYNLDRDNQLHIVAAEGQIDQNKKIMYLKEGINVTGERYNLIAKQLQMDFDKSYIWAEEGVKINYDNSNIQSNECVIFSNSKNMRCDGNVQANISFNGF